MTEATLPRPVSYSGFLDRPLWAAVGLNWEKALYAVLIALAIITRFYHLGDRVISHDESLHTFYSWELSKGKGFQHTPLMHGPLQFHALALSYTLFGASDFTARIPAAICGVVAVWLMYFFRRWLGRAGALLAALFFLISPYLLYYTRYSREDPYTLVWQLLMAIALFCYMETKADRYIYLLVGAFSLFSATKENSFFNAAMWLLFLGLIYLREMFTADWDRPDFKRFFTYSLLGAGLSALVAGGFYWYGRYSDWAKTNAPVVVQGDVAVQPPANQYLVMMEIALVVLVLFLSVAALFSFLSFKEKLRDYPAFSLMLVLFTFVFPQLSALPVKLFLNADPLDYSSAGLLKTATIFVPMFVLAAALGMVWDWKKWLIAAGIFYGIYVPLYTTMFTNGGGFFTGMVGSLGYWLDQQDVQRGSQPWYYYLLVQIPIYEFLPAIGALVASGIGVYRWITAADIPEEEQSLVDRPRRSQPEKFPVLAFLGYWSLLAIGIYSYAGEKMPWLTVHLSLPMVLMAGWGFGRVFEMLDVQKFQINRAWAAVVLVPLTVYALAYTVFRLGFSGMPPFQGNELDSLQATLSFVFALVVTVGAGVGVYVVAQKVGWRQIVALSAVIGVIGLVLLTARAAFYASYINFDNQTEFVNYASGAPGVKTVMAQVEEISKRTTDGMGIKVAYDDDVSWPITWYMRDFTSQIYYGNSPTRETFQDVPLIIAGDNNWSKVEPLLGNRYYTFEYIRMWWPMQEYFNLDKPGNADKTKPAEGIDRLWNALQSSDYRQAIFNIWFFRDYTKYGELTSVDYSLSRWPVADRMRLYIRKDIASQLWPLGLGPSAAQTASENIYNNKISLAADLAFGSEGSAEGQFTSPRAVAVGPDGSVYVADTRAHRIQKFTADGQFIKSWGSFGRIEDNSALPGTFNEIWGIAVDNNGFVYASDTWNHRIQKFTADGEFVKTWGTFGLTDAGLTAMWGPRGVAVDSQNNVYVADTGNKRILVFDSEGNPLRQIGTGGALEGQLDEPTDVAVANDGRVFVADTWNQRIQVFSSAGDVLGKWSIEGWFSQNLDNKPYLTIDSQNRVYVTDPEGYRVLVFTEGGLFQYTFGDYGADNSTFGLPVGVAIRNSWLYVADANNNRVMRFTVDSDQ